MGRAAYFPVVSFWCSLGLLALLGFPSETVLHGPEVL